jgi:Uri superfamily endonuclease
VDCLPDNAVSPSARGSYILIIRLPERREISVGSLGRLDFEAGYYAYVGSALGGLKSRLSRHVRRDKTLRGHIDYLLREAAVQEILVFDSQERTERDIARLCAGSFRVVRGFGSSDCRCGGHLFYHEVPMTGIIRSLTADAGYRPELINETKRTGNA